MATSLEVRVPILDHRVFELAWRLPRELRIDGKKGKIALREVLARRVPRNLFERPKMGFAVPIDEWLRGPLRDWAESLLQPSDLEAIGLKPDMVQKTWNEHIGGGFNRQMRLWPILMLRAWSDHWGIKG
jgi:asparagine synthase (glutamine-hydrolysing)